MIKIKQKEIMAFSIILLALVASSSNLFAGETKTFKMTAKKYEFLPNTIEVNQGDRVVLEITALDRDHGIGIVGLDIERDLPHNKTVVIEFVAAKKGEFTIKCTTFCGWGHFGMSGKLIVS